jgi:hypothetical protein
MAAQAAAKFARLKKTLNMKHCVIVAMVNTIRKTNTTLPSECSRTLPPCKIKKSVKLLASHEPNNLNDAFVQKAVKIIIMPHLYLMKKLTNIPLKLLLHT